MIYQGQAFQVVLLEEGIAALQFDLTDSSVNKFNQLALTELAEAITVIEATSSLRGLVLTSAKEAFIVGADITEFVSHFQQDEATLLQQIQGINQLFCRLEALNMPLVAAVNGIALGGGCEYALCADYRVLSTTASIGLPEVKLGIYPGWGGTVRLPRLIGADNGIEWIAGGKTYNAEQALAVGVADAVVSDTQLMPAALAILHQAISGELDYHARRQEKHSPLALSPIEATMVFESAGAVVKQKAGKHMKAPVAALKTIQKHALHSLEKALEIEVKGFVQLAKTEVSQALIGLFLNDQGLKKIISDAESQALPVTQAAVLGAGIMGGGIAYQSALKGTAVIMKDVQQNGLDLGLCEATKLLAKRVKRGRLDVQGMGEVLNRIVPALSYGEFDRVDLVVEAVVEKAAVKKALLAEVEKVLPAHAVLTSNTSTISINTLAEDLQRPEQFCGMHFFNPVHRMPLVEVIRGKHSSEATIATVVQYAKAMGKTPIVVNDCAGFLVNRVLFPYFAGFTALLRDGADFAQIDKVMTDFGWPMGPAYLLDVVGIDTAIHAEMVMAQAYPDRMQKDYKTAIDVFFERERFGQKNGVGFYRYKTDKKGKPKQMPAPKVYDMLTDVCAEQRDFSDEEIIARMMLPLCLETVRALEEGIVSTVAEADMALIMGIGFPVFRGGALRYIDQMGVANFVALAKQYQHLDALYHVTDGLQAMANAGGSFYGDSNAIKQDNIQS